MPRQHPGEGGDTPTAGQSGQSGQRGQREQREGRAERQRRQDRARRRAVRAYAALAGVAYSVAARQIAAAGLREGEVLGSAGRTVYPRFVGAGREWTIVAREARSPEAKLADCRRAARMVYGRAAHLAERFPPGADGAFYGGERRVELLALLYLVVVHDSPGLVPAPLDLAWTAELGEETAVDAECADVDRAARLVLDCGAAQRWERIAAALRGARRDTPDADEPGTRRNAAHADQPDARRDGTHPDQPDAWRDAAHADEPFARRGEELGEERGAAGVGDGVGWSVWDEADLLERAYRGFVTPGEDARGEPFVVRAPWEGVRQVLDALLVVADDGHAPGTRVRIIGANGSDGAGNGADGGSGARAGGAEGTAEGTVVGACWGAGGPPVGYEVRVDGEAATRTLRPEEIVILPGQESDAPVLQLG